VSTAAEVIQPNAVSKQLCLLLQRRVTSCSLYRSRVLTVCAIVGVLYKAVAMQQKSGIIEVESVVSHHEFTALR
jgi:hypothetical protein